MKYKVGIYLRLSNEDDHYKESESIKNQRLLLKEYINNNPEYTLYKEYCDENLSGAGTYRPAFEELIKDCKNHKIDIVLCKSQSRFSRDIEVIEKYLGNKFPEWNIRFISLTDNIDSKINETKKTRQINSLVNEWFLEDLSKNIRSALYIKMNNNELISPFSPYGYIKKNNKLIIDPISKEYIKYIYKLYLKGYSISNIKDILNKKNIPSPGLYKIINGSKLNINTKDINSLKWNNNTIKNILSNEVYIGNLIQGKRTTINYKNHKIITKNKQEWITSLNTHEPIISKEIFLKVQKNISKHTRTNNHKTFSIFQRTAICLKCNKKLYQKKNKHYTYLFCKECKQSIRQDKLEDIILKELNNLSKLYFTPTITIPHNKRTSLTYYSLKLNTKLKELYNSLQNKEITPEEFIILKKEYQKEKDILKQTKELTKKENTIITTYNKLTTYIIEEFIENIQIDKDKIIINYNF